LTNLSLIEDALIARQTTFKIKKINSEFSDENENLELEETLYQVDKLNIMLNIDDFIDDFEWMEDECFLLESQKELSSS